MRERTERKNVLADQRTHTEAQKKERKKKAQCFQGT